MRNSNEGQSNEKVTHVLHIFHGTPNSPNSQNAQGHCAVHFTMKHSLDAKENDEKEKALGFGGGRFLLVCLGAIPSHVQGYSWLYRQE